MEGSCRLLDRVQGVACRCVGCGLGSRIDGSTVLFNYGDSWEWGSSDSEWMEPLLQAAGMGVKKELLGSEMKKSAAGETSSRKLTGWI